MQQEESLEARDQREHVSNSGKDGALATVVLYDADAEQRIPFLMEEDGVSHEVAYILGPQNDAALIEYERRMEERVMQADEAETGVRDAVEQTNNSFQAGLWLFENRLVDVDGFVEPGEAKPENWRELIGTDSDKVAVIDSAYLGVDIAPAPISHKGKLRGFKPPSSSFTVPLRALFEGHEMLLKHERIQVPTADQITDFKAIMKRSWLIGGTRFGTGEALVPPKGQRLGALYDQMGYRASGYKGRVPLHHKRRVVIHDLSKHVSAVTKK